MKELEAGMVVLKVPGNGSWYVKPFPVVNESVTGILGGEIRIPSYTFFLKTWMCTVPKVGVELQDKLYCKKTSFT